MPIKSMNKAGNRLSLLTVAMAFAWCPTVHGQQFSVVDLGTLGGPMAGGFGISANRLVVGYSALPDATFHGFLWDGLIHDLLPLAGDTLSHAFDINGSGWAVGVSYSLGGLISSAMLWQCGTLSNLGTFAARGISDAGSVVGYVSSAIIGKGWVDRACVLKNGSLTTLATLGGSNSYAYDVNGSDQIVGMSYTAGEGSRRGCLWQNGLVFDLGTLGGTTSQAYAINTSGQVVGVADTATGLPHAFLFPLNGAGQVTARIDLGELGGGFSYAYSINSLGEVAGTSNSRAFYWKNGTLIDLNRRIPTNSGWLLNSATGINDNGDIVGMGTYHGWPHAFLLSPAAPDFDHDGDVDQIDFAHLQMCYSGTGLPQTNPACWDALLDNNDYVGLDDLTIFRNCARGPEIPALPGCWR